MGPILPALCALLVLSSGCLGGASSGLEQEGPTTSRLPADFENRVLAWGLAECRFIVASFPVREAALAAYLPPGFAPRPLSLPGGATAGASLGMEAFECRDGMGLNGTIAGLHYGSVFTPVIPPQNRTLEGVQSYYVKWDVLVPDQDRRRVLSEAGVPARNGSARVQVSSPGGPAQLVQAELSLEGLGAFRMMGPLGDDNGANRFTFVEYTATPHGLASWHGLASNRLVDRGQGTIRLDPSSWVYRVAGAEQMPALLAVGLYTFTNATITLPAS